MQVNVEIHLGTCSILEFKMTGFKKNAWTMVILDDADVANALAHHDLTPDGLRHRVSGQPNGSLIGYSFRSMLSSSSVVSQKSVG